MNEPVAELRQLTKRFGRRNAVKDVTLTIPRGVVYGLVGPNGAGKTTLMRAMLGFTSITSGEAFLFGKKMPKARGEVYPRIGVIIEEPRFFRFLSGRNNLRQVSTAHAQNIDEARIDEVLAMVGLSERADDRVKTYSLGMRQRLGIARALLHDPELLILDEPSNGLDPAGIREMRLLLRGLAAEGRTIFVSSHLLSEIELMCDHVAILKGGELITESIERGNESISIKVDDPQRAQQIIANSPSVASVQIDESEAGVLIVSLEMPAREASGRETPQEETLQTADEISASLNALLVDSGVRVSRIQPTVSTLEQRFMEIVE